MSAAEIQTPAQLSALKTGLWAPSKYCDCTSQTEEGSAAAQALKRLHPCFETEGLLKLRGCNWEKKQLSPLLASSSPLSPAPVSSLL